MGGWTKPLCDLCWHARNPDRSPHRVLDLDTEAPTPPQVCGDCGCLTVSGIYIREKPDTNLSVNHPHSWFAEVDADE